MTKSNLARWFVGTILLVTAGLAQSQVSPAEDVVTYFHSDHLGSPVAATDANGQRLWVREYSAFGERLEGPGQGESLIGYAGHEQEDSGLSYQRSRWYHPQLGRFLQPDPVGFVPANTLSANRYLYVNNNPYTYYDPDGEYLFSAIDVISISLGVASAIKNFSDGNIREGLYDVAGVAVDGVMLLAPVPGGVGMARHAARHADDAVDAGRTLARACSFAEGTPVHTPTGLAAIENLVYGDQLLAKNEATGDLTYKRILDAYNHYHTDGLTITVGNTESQRETLVATGEHPFYVIGQGFTRADELTAGQQIATHTQQPVEVLDVDLSPLELVAYNYTVEDYETYFVGEFGLWVHN
ncbi:polymorphic toxin-type HINT domain-containing protein, partial [Saccharospirillum impatiens]|uniref:polymorphic toxin-type HINT domain-containing protein n=1 Tax=Saccharospirillum impatiens TaxID=169438 RepID=UPI00146ACDBC